MGLIGMKEAAERLGLTRPSVALRLLKANGVPVQYITARAAAVDEADLAAFETRRRERGRPKKEADRP